MSRKVNARNDDVDEMRGDHPQAWRKLLEGWIKVNLGGSVNLVNGEAQCGGLLREFRGKWLWCYAKAMGSSANPWEAETWGVLEGLRLAWDKGFKRVIVELDVLNLV